jgi:hypothetical protein
MNETSVDNCVTYSVARKLNGNGNRTSAKFVSGAQKTLHYITLQTPRCGAVELKFTCGPINCSRDLEDGQGDFRRQVKTVGSQ